MADDAGADDGAAFRSVDELRAQAARRRDEQVAARRRLLELAPGDLRDLDAAAECGCSCHPSPGGDPHEGKTCPCQLTPDDRAQRHADLAKSLTASRAAYALVHQARTDELAAAAAALGVEAVEDGPGAPWVIVGTVDGHGFYMRERWDTYDIVVAPDDDPTIQPWGAPIETPTTVIRSGTISDLLPGASMSYRHVLAFVVGEIRTYLRRRTCEHPSARGDRFCRACGSPLVDPAEPAG